MPHPLQFHDPSSLASPAKDSGGQAGESPRERHSQRQIRIGSAIAISRRRLLVEAKEMFADFATDLRATHPERAELFVNSAHRVLRKINGRALRDIIRHVNFVIFAANREMMREVARKFGADDWQETLAFFDPDTRTLCLNGARETGDSRAFELSEIYAHEFAHALDLGRVFSDRPAWIAAWSREILDGRLGIQAASSPTEGFASFAELAILRSNVAAAELPRCMRFWIKSGLE
ncbi:MAG: hypothetical protein SFU86_17700 [Pirellulaceae bacterium]|nr:hypothetical protein [Pirellulaceae bacterium]